METIAFDLDQTRRTPLEPEHIAAIRAAGVPRRYAAGTTIVEQGDRMTRFTWIEAGEVETVNVVNDARLYAHTLGPGQFMGEITFLAGGHWSLSMRAAQDTQVIEVDREAMLTLMSQIPEMSDIVISVFAARRRRQIEGGVGALRLIGEDEDPAVRRVAQFCDRNRIPYHSFALGSVEAREVSAQCAVPSDRPAVVVGRDQVVVDPTPAKVATLLGMDLAFDRAMQIDVLIVGGGPAGVAAAVYAGAEGLCALVSEDLAIGGQAGASSRIENYMGFPTGISGADLVWRGEVQAMKFGTRFAMPLRATKLEPCDDGSFRVTFDNGEVVRTRAVVVATGVEYRRMPLDNLERFEGNGVYYAATEIEARYCRGTEAVIIGGGNSAGQAAMYLSRNASHVHVMVRGASLAESMSSYLTERLRADPRITVHYCSEVEAIDGDDRLRAVRILDRVNHARSTIISRALFIMVGAAPNTAWLDGQIDLDAQGFIRTGGECGLQDAPFATSRAGVFAVGDVRSGSVKRVASAVGEGSVVISQVYRHVRPDG